MRIFYILLVVCLMSCVKKEEPRQKVLDRELQIKINAYKKKKAKYCKRTMMEEISVEVDSLMYSLVSQMNGETDIMPTRPSRPSRLVDTIKLETMEEK